MTLLTDQIDKAANLAHLQAQSFRELAITEGDKYQAARLLGRAEALCNAVTDLCSLSLTDRAQRRALAKLLIHTSAAAGALDERPAQERPLKIAN